MGTMQIELEKKEMSDNLFLSFVRHAEEIREEERIAMFFVQLLRTSRSQKIANQV